MEVKGMSAAEWCFNMRDKSFSEGDVKSGNAYQDLGLLWQERETKGEANKVDRTASQ